MNDRRQNASLAFRVVVATYLMQDHLGLEKVITCLKRQQLSALDLELERPFEHVFANWARMTEDW